jgi:hypothetical protein
MDGSPIDLGDLDNAPKILSELSFSINGQALLLNNSKNNSLGFFDVQTGKFIFEEKNSLEFEKMEICFNPYTG